MDALRELLTTGVGLLSLAAIAGVIGIGVWLVRWFIRQIEADPRARPRG
jgi:uncharacterized membrane-anchored protein